MALKKVVYIQAKDGETAQQRFETLVSVGSLDGHTYDPDNDYRLEEETGTVSGVTDVKVNGSTIVDDNGVANIPTASNGVLGLFVTSGSSGLNVGSTGNVSVNTCTDAQIDALTNTYRPITPSNLVYATKVGMLNNTSLTNEEKTTIKSNLGIEGGGGSSPAWWYLSKDAIGTGSNTIIYGSTIRKFSDGSTPGSSNPMAVNDIVMDYRGFFGRVSWSSSSSCTVTRSQDYSPCINTVRIKATNSYSAGKITDITVYLLDGTTRSVSSVSSGNYWTIFYNVDRIEISTNTEFNPTAPDHLTVSRSVLFGSATLGLDGNEYLGSFHDDMSPFTLNEITTPYGMSAEVIPDGGAAIRLGIIGSTDITFDFD